jgi:hypothetical protein
LVEASPDDLRNELTPWLSRIHVDELNLLGGEPLVNKHSPSIVAAARELLPDSRLTVTTNALNSERLPQLIAACIDANALMIVSLHRYVDAYRDQLAPSLELIEDRIQEPSGKLKFLVELAMPNAIGYDCRELAEFDSSVDAHANVELQGDEQLLAVLASGCHIQNAATIVGVSERTVYRRLADPQFRTQLDHARNSLRESIIAKLADAAHDAIGVLNDLMHTADDERVRLGAAKSVIDALLTVQRVATLEKKAGEKPEPQAKRVTQMIMVMPDDGRDPVLTERLQQAGARLATEFQLDD